MIRLQYHLGSKHRTYSGIGYSYNVSHTDILGNSSSPVFQLGTNVNIRENLDLNFEIIYFAVGKVDIRNNNKIVLKDALSISSYHISCGLNVKL